jgi:hypothetical protein
VADGVFVHCFVEISRAEMLSVAIVVAISAVYMSEGAVLASQVLGEASCAHFDRWRSKRGVESKLAEELMENEEEIHVKVERCSLYS